MGSADDEKYDQVLDSVLVGPVAIGTSKFVFQVNHKRAPGTTRVLPLCQNAGFEGDEVVQGFMGFDASSSDVFARLLLQM